MPRTSPPCSATMRSQRWAVDRAARSGGGGQSVHTPEAWPPTRRAYRHATRSSGADGMGRAGQADTGHTGCQDLSIRMGVEVGQRRAWRVTVPAYPRSGTQTECRDVVGGTAVRGVVAVALTAFLALAACGAASGVDAQGPVTPEPSTARGSSAPPTNTSTGPGTSTASPTSGAFPESDQILNQYRQAGRPTTKRCKHRATYRCKSQAEWLAGWLAGWLARVGVVAAGRPGPGVGNRRPVAVLPCVLLSRGGLRPG